MKPKYLKSISLNNLRYRLLNKYITLKYYYLWL